MKKTVRVLLAVSAFLLLTAMSAAGTAMLLGAPLPADPALLAPEAPGYADLPASFSGKASLSPLAYTTGGVKTYLYSDCSLKWLVPNKTVNGKSCTAMQGMDVTDNYIYISKIYSDESVCAIIRTDVRNGSQTVMKYYSSLTATTATGCDCCGHANDLTIVDTPDGQYMYVVTCAKGNALARMKIVDDKLYFTGYFNLVNSSGSQISASAIRDVMQDDQYVYMYIKNAMRFYRCRIPLTATGNPTTPSVITCYSAFNIDVRNALYSTTASDCSPRLYAEQFTNQGFFYSREEHALYVPLWCNANGKKASIITVYDVSAYDTEAVMKRMSDASISAISNTVYAGKLSFYINNSSESMFEIESCGFREGQGANGDKTMYFMCNASSAGEGIYQVRYNCGSAAIGTTVDSDDIIFTVKYNANGGVQPTVESHYDMAATIHVDGIPTAIRPNTYTRDGYVFRGWTFNRSSDSKWLYRSADEKTEEWYQNGKQPAGYTLALYTDKQILPTLTTVRGDSITAFAQWRGNNDYTVSYNAGSGTGAPRVLYVTPGDSFTVSEAVPTYSGNFFLGWATSSGATAPQYTGGETVTPTGSMTLYAVWRPIRYTIRYYANGGTGTMADSAATWGVNMPLSKNTFTRAGRSFTGWHLSRISDNKWLYWDASQKNPTWYAPGSQPAGWTVALYADQRTIGKLSSAEGDVVTLHAQWSGAADTFTVSFDANGGKNAPAAVTYTSAGTNLIPAAVPTRDEMIFLGWSEDKNAIRPSFTAGAPYVGCTSALLYAVWTDAPLVNLISGQKLIMYGDTANGTSFPLTKTGITGLTDGEYGSNGTGYTDWAYAKHTVSVLSGAEIDGMTFTSSYKSIDPGTEVPVTRLLTDGGIARYWYTVEAELPELSRVNGVTITAQGYKKYVLDGGADILVSADGAEWEIAAHAADLFNAAAPFHWEGITSTDVNANGSANDAPAALTVTFDAFYNVRYVAYGCTVPREINGHYTNRFTEIEVWGVPGEILPADLTVTFDANGGSSGSAPGAVVSVRRRPVLLPEAVPTRPGYAFLGWATEANAASADFAAGEKYVPTSDITLYAVWRATFVWGDCDGDGNVNAADLAVMRRYIADYDYNTGLSSVAFAFGMDADGNGTANSGDLALLRRYLAEFDARTGTSPILLGPKNS